MHIALIIALIFIPTTPKNKSKKNQQKQQVSFEQLSNGALILDYHTIEKAVGPFLQSCGNTNDLPDIQCNAIKKFMQRRAMRRIYLTTAKPDALVFGEYDSSKFVYPITVLGCISCKKPLSFDPVLYKPNKIYITTKLPTSLNKNKLQGIELAKFEIPVDPRKMGKWLKTVKSNLRVQFLYRVTPDGIWDKKLGHGFTLHMGGFRVYNKCTGEILYSQPPSQGTVPIDNSCKKVTKIVKKPKNKLPKILRSSTLLFSMQKIRGELHKCYELYQIPGKSILLITIRGKDGKVSNVKIKGFFKGTPTGSCLIKAVKKAVFPEFKKNLQKFKYPVNFP